MFQRLLDEVQIGTRVETEIVVISQTFEEHLRHLPKVLLLLTRCQAAPEL